MTKVLSFKHYLKSTCDVNLLSKLSINFKECSYEQSGQGRSYCSLCTLDTIHRNLFVTRLIINKINKVQWVDFKLENVLCVIVTEVRSRCSS